MTDFDETRYRLDFHALTGNEPFRYQVDVARKLLQGQHVVLRAPTGAGKTMAVLVPFLRGQWTARPSRLIYALPLRSLAQSIYREALCLVCNLDGSPDSVTLQTGEQPDDPFFERGKIIVTTYDQVLSGYLHGPYGLSHKLHNINAAAVAGALVVFDEFHLMEPQAAFLTAVAMAYQYRELCQTVWMTATATEPYVQCIKGALGAGCVPETDGDWKAMLEELPSVTQVRRQLSWESGTLTPDAVLKAHRGRSMVLLNTVDRAQEMFEAIQDQSKDSANAPKVVLLHSRFFRQHRREKEKRLRDWFGKELGGSAILVATQVVEAGLDISCNQMHTELCPMNSLAQRAGRCARFKGQEGTVHVYLLPEGERSWLPYDPGAMKRTQDLLEQIHDDQMDPAKVLEWVESVHGEDDLQALRETWSGRLDECRRRVHTIAVQRQLVRVSDLIRRDDEGDVHVIIAHDGDLPDKPSTREGLSVSRGRLRHLVSERGATAGWYWDPETEVPWQPLDNPDKLGTAYVVCLRPGVAAYQSEVGLRLDKEGREVSPFREPAKRPGHVPLKCERWSAHSQAVADEALRRLKALDGGPGGLLVAGMGRKYGLKARDMEAAVRACGLLHDLGKLQESWQRWAEATQRAKNPMYKPMAPLAHTDYDYDSPEDRERERRLGICRPDHAAASAYLAGAFVSKLLSALSEEHRAPVARACVMTVLGHHGAGPPNELVLNQSSLCTNWEEAVGAVGMLADQRAMSERLKKLAKDTVLGKALEPAIGADGWAKWWPLVAYLTRALRLSDQAATREGARDE